MMCCLYNGKPECRVQNEELPKAILNSNCILLFGSIDPYFFDTLARIWAHQHILGAVLQILPFMYMYLVIKMQIGLMKIIKCCVKLHHNFITNNKNTLFLICTAVSSTCSNPRWSNCFYWPPHTFIHQFSHLACTCNNCFKLFLKQPK